MKNLMEHIMPAKFQRNSPHDLVKIGLITGQGGHSEGIWARKMNPAEGQIRTTGMLLTHAFTIKPDMKARFQTSFPDVEMVANPVDMIEHIDGVYIDDINAISIYPQLARPFLEAGIPTFVNRPFATSLTKGQEMIDMAAQFGTALLTASTWEYSEGVGDLRARAAEMPILGYVAHNSMSDYYSHGLHGVWYIHAILKDEIKKGRGRMTAAAYHTPDWRTSPGMVVFEHESSEIGYYGALHMASGADGNAYMRIFGDHHGDAEARIPARPLEFQYNTWNAMQLVTQQMIETGVSPQTGDEMMEKLAMFLLPFYSILEGGGDRVERSVLDHWELPAPGPALMKGDHPADSAFQAPHTDAELDALLNML
jgi:hypothetical protein